MDDKRPDIYVVAMVYYKSYFPNLVNSLRKLRQDQQFKKIILVVNNPAIDPEALQSALSGLASHSQSVMHDNTGGDFGAYQRGIEALRADLHAGACLIILNETLGIHFPFETEHAGAFMRSLLDQTQPGRVVGHIDHFERSVAIDDYSAARWVRSNLIGLDFEAIRCIDYRIYAPHIHDYVREIDVVDDFFSDKIDLFLRQYIADWLFMAGRWYGSATLSKSNAKSLAFKARSILQEKYLSMRLEQQKVAFLTFRYTPGEQVMRRVKHGLKRIARAIGATKRLGRA